MCYNSTTLSHITNNITMLYITTNKQYKTIIHISYFQFVNILARKIKGETFILNRPLNLEAHVCQRTYCANTKSHLKPAKIIRIIYYVFSTNTATDCLVIVWILRTVRGSHKHSDCLDRASHYEP